MILEVRNARRKDADALETFLEETNDRSGPNTTFIGVADIIRKPPTNNFYAILALDGKNIVGALLAGPAGALINANTQLTQAQRDAVALCLTEIAWIVVKPDARRNGIGTALIEYAENEIKKKNSVAILFFDHAKKGLRRFYENNNYRLVPRGHGIAVQPPAKVDPIGVQPTYQAAYKMLKPHVSVEVLRNGHVIHGAFDV